MAKKASFILLVFLTLLCIAAAGKEQLLRFTANGFSIALLEDAEARQVVTMFLAPSDGFAPNVGVQIQPYNGALNEYVELSKLQFKAANITISNEKSTDKSWTCDSSGAIKDRNLRFYSKAELGRGTAYLVTATALQSQWEKHGAKLKNCVDSFNRDEGERNP